MNSNQLNNIKYEKFSQSLNFTSFSDLDYFNNALAKSKASRGKLMKVEANSSTPLNRAFFVRRFHTPKRKTEIRLFNQSMMACSGQSLRLASFPLLLVFHPATRYRQSVERLVIAFNQFSKGLLAMIYQFLGISRQHYDQSKAEQLRINADTIEQVKAKIAPFFVVLGEIMRNSCLTTSSRSPYAIHALAKSKASREKLNIEEANSSTPLNRAFFVRRFHTPQRKTEIRLFNQSMMACSGQSLRLASFPFLLVSHPATRYRQTVRSLAIAFNQFRKGLLAMIYQFLGISRQHYDQSKAEQLRILADNEAQARAYLAPNYVLVKLGQLPDSALNLNTILLKGVNHA